MATKIMKWGNSQGLRLTKAILSRANLKVGDEVTISARPGRIIIEPAATVRGKYDLTRLIEEIPDNVRTDEVRWGPPIGKEIW